VRAISNLERGINKAPYPSTIRRISDALVLSGEDRTELAASARHPVERRGDRMVIEGGFLDALPTARLVARGEELGRVLDGLEAVEGGSGRLVLLAGEPGIGQTRLAQEASVHAWDSRFLVAAGRCYEAQSGVPFYPFLEALSTRRRRRRSARRSPNAGRIWPGCCRITSRRGPRLLPRAGRNLSGCFGR
jgi:hypothetical protein